MGQTPTVLLHAFRTDRMSQTSCKFDEALSAQAQSPRIKRLDQEVSGHGLNAPHTPAIQLISSPFAPIGASGLDLLGDSAWFDANRLTY